MSSSDRLSSDVENFEARPYDLYCEYPDWLIRLADFAWKVYPDRYIEVMVEALVSSQSAVESEFTSLLLSIDGLRHPLLRGTFCDLELANADYWLSVSNFAELRLQVLKGACWVLCLMFVLISLQ